MKKLSIIIMLIILVSTNYAQDNLLIRFPALNNDGSKIAFSFQGDIWTVPSSGGKATRLTIHEAYESNPIFSPDGKEIAFSGARYSNNDIFVIPTEGGTAKQLTYHSSNDLISSWSTDDNILFSTSREYDRIERPQEIFSISSKGSTEQRILDAVGFEPILSPDGRFLAFVRGDINPIHRKDYRGSSVRTIWLYDTKNKNYIQLPGFETNNINKSGRYNE